MQFGASKNSILFGISALALWQTSPTLLFALDDKLGSQQIAPDAAVNTADFAVAGAEELMIDIPSAFHSARYQRGEMNGLRYFLFPDGSAKVMGGVDFRTALMELECQAGVSCKVTGHDGAAFTVFAIGAPKPELPLATNAEALARYLAEWILAGTGTAPPTPVIEPEPIVQVEPTNVEADDEPTLDPIDEFTVEVVEPDPLPQTQSVEELEPLCSEPEPLLPSSCAQPTSDIQKRAPSVVQARVPVIAQIQSFPDEPSPELQVAPIVPKEQTLFERLDLSCSLTGSASLSYAGSVGKPRASFGCNSNLSDKLSLRFSLLKYVISGEKQDWDPDFTYAFTYRVSDEFSLGYSNYSAQYDDFFGSLASGSLRASYKLPTFNLPNDKPVACSASLGLPDPTDASANISCGYALTDKIRIGGTINLYAPDAQGDFDPDYSYTASYRPNDDWIVSYSNYSNNRWPWNRGEYAGPGLKGGSLSVTYAFDF